MSILNYASLKQNSANFITGQATKIFLSYPYALGNTVSTYSFNLSNSVTTGATRLYLSSSLSPYPLYEGTRLSITFQDISVNPIVTYTKILYVSQYTTVGSNFIAVLPYGDSQTIPANTTVTVNAWVPLFSADTLNLEQTATIISEQVLNGNLNTIKANVGIDSKATIQGTQVYSDPGLTILSSAYQNAQLVNFQVLKTNQLGGCQFAAYVSSYPTNISRTKFIQQSINLERHGATTYFNN